MNLVLLIRKAGTVRYVALLIAGLLCSEFCAQPTILPTVQLTPALVEPASPAPNITLTPTSLPTIEPPPTSTATPTPEPQRNPVGMEITEGSEARYLVREQFAHRNVSDDAIGKTGNVTGVIQFDGRGTIIPAESILIVDLGTPRIGDDGRDDYLRGESLKSDRFPLAEFVAIGTADLPRPLPTDGEINVLLLGDMLMDNNTSRLTWETTSQFAPDQIVGTAKTNFDLTTFYILRSSRLLLLSFEDNIRL